ncbi:MAG: heme-dependent oxidative N-demethylase subunit alpha family protein [Pirellulales bacterium]
MTRQDTFTAGCHPYRDGYSVLPKLKPLTGPVFDEQLPRFLQAKQEAALHQPCYFESDLDPARGLRIGEYIRQTVGGDFQRRHAHGGLRQMGQDLREDIAIHCLDGNRDWLAAAHVSLPSGWLPQDKIGKSFAEVHREVPGMRLDISRKMVEAMIYSSPYERYVWTVIFEDRINGHPRIPRQPFNAAAPQLFVRYERQVIIGFPDLSAALFVICQHLIPEASIDKPALRQALAGMTPEQRIYKGFDDSYPDLMRYLA